MKTAAIVLLLVVALPAQAQVYRCVDANGKRSFADKPGPGCVADPKYAAPKAPAAAVGGTSPSKFDKSDPLKANLKDAKARGTLVAGKSASAPKQPPETANQHSGRCETMKQQRAWLSSPRGEGVQGREAQLAQIDKALRDCN